MNCCRFVLGTILAARAVGHAVIAGFAANDLYKLSTYEKNAFFQIASVVTRIPGDIAEAVKLPLIFYVMCGVLLLLATTTFPLRDRHRPRLPYYLIFQALFDVMVIYVVYIHTIPDLSFIPDRDFYQIMSNPVLYPVSLVLDIITMLAVLSSVGKRDPDSGNVRIVYGNLA